MTASIIKFSDYRRPVDFPEPKSPEEIELDRLQEINTVLDEVVPTIVAELIDSGFDVTGDRYVKDVGMIVEAVRAAMFRVDGRDHGLHIISNKIKTEGTLVRESPLANTAVDSL